MDPFLVAGFKKGVELGLLQGEGFTVEDIFTESVQAALKQKALHHATLATQTTKGQLQTLLQQAFDEGQGIPELARGINEQFKINSRVRSVRIARTEMTDVINDGTLRTLIREGYTQKEWSTVIDGRERDAHHSANGQTVGINDLFTVGGESARYPGDDNLSAAGRVNCRCTLVGAGIPEDRKYQLGQRFLRTHTNLENRFVVYLRRAFEQQRRRILSHFPSE